MDNEERVPIRSAWPTVRYVGKLTDRKIEKYQKAGFYTAEFREARRQWMNRKKSTRDGNFIRTPDGLVFSPL